MEVPLNQFDVFFCFFFEMWPYFSAPEPIFQPFFGDKSDLAKSPGSLLAKSKDFTERELLMTHGKCILGTPNEIQVIAKTIEKLILLHFFFVRRHPQ